VQSRVREDAADKSPGELRVDGGENVQDNKGLGKSRDGTPVEDKRLIRARQRAIGRELKRFFDDVAEEPVPEDFSALLRKIDDSDKVKGKEGNETS
jgi:hypothetical protein